MAGSREATVVAGPPSLVRQLKAERDSARIFSTSRSRIVSLVSALRPHQWAKNALVFMPVIAGHQIMRVDVLWTAALTFVAFSLCASGIYILNDISDVRRDRQHSRKGRRPFASGELSIPVGVVSAVGLLVSAAVLEGSVCRGTWRPFSGLTRSSRVLTPCDSSGCLAADVFTLTGLYVLRILAGAIATSTLLTTWLLAFALFFFLGLAFVKRYVEVMATRGQLPGREYGPDDAMWMHAVGTCASYMAVVVLALYVNTPEVTNLYAHPDVLWLLCPVLLFWLTRLWFRAGRRLIHDDPVVEALRDPLSYVTLAAASIILVVAAV